MWDDGTEARVARVRHVVQGVISGFQQVDIRVFGYLCSPSFVQPLSLLLSDRSTLCDGRLLKLSAVINPDSNPA